MAVWSNDAGHRCVIEPRTTPPLDHSGGVVRELPSCRSGRVARASLGCAGYAESRG